MRVVLQRVLRASVIVAGEMVGSISQGLLAFVGVGEGDTEDLARRLAVKAAEMRIFNDTEGRFNLSVQDVDGGVLVISQFTLHASTKKGNRPSYVRAARPEVAVPLYEQFLKKLAADIGRPIQTGEFGADMQVALVNDGPVTILIDTKNRE